MDFSKALIIVVLSYAMRKLENMAPFLVFLWHYLTNLWQCHQALIPLAGGGLGLVRVGACVEATWRLPLRQAQTSARKR